MAEDTKNEANTQNQGAPKGPSVQINAQYVKDLSFENPNAPAVLINQQEKPQVEINVDLQANALNAEQKQFEISLTLTAKATNGKGTAFLVELTYGGVFTLHNVQDKDIEPTLLVYCPTMLFPYARRVISDATRDGGFPPLMLDPIDFGTLYMARKQQQANEAAAAGSDDTQPGSSAQIN
jgi:preprotein translocase subunit SecB